MSPLEIIASLSVSDWFLLSLIVPLTWFTIVYGFLTKWFEDPLGWVILSGAVGMLAVLGLIIYGLFTGERAPEVVRSIVFGLVLASWVGKVVVLHNERRKGKLEKRHPRSYTEPVTIIRKDTP